MKGCFSIQIYDRKGDSTILFENDCYWHRMVDAGNTVVMIEHNLDVIAETAIVIDFSPCRPGR